MMSLSEEVSSIAAMMTAQCARRGDENEGVAQGLENRRQEQRSAGHCHSRQTGRGQLCPL